MFSTGILLTLITGILLIIGWLAASFWGIINAFIIAGIVFIISYAYCERFILSMYNARPTKNVILESIVKDIARDAGMPTPSIYMIETDEPIPNSFSLGSIRTIFSNPSVHLENRWAVIVTNELGWNTAPTSVCTDSVGLASRAKACLDQ